MSSSPALLLSIRAAIAGLTLAELLSAHPGIARRTAQRMIARLIDSGQVTALGAGRVRRYVIAQIRTSTNADFSTADRFPHSIPVSADSQDILAYIDKPIEARKPVGYQRDFWMRTAPINAHIYQNRCAGNCIKWVQPITLRNLRAPTAAPF